MSDLTPLLPKAAEIIGAAKALGLKIATAESCTGGLLSALLTEIAGASAVFDRGFVTYSNQAKTDMLGVDPQLISRVGAVSAEVALAMAEGALAHSLADVALSITGIAGPGGGSVEKPVGLIHFGAARRGRNSIHVSHVFKESRRSAIRLAALSQALALLRQTIEVV